MIRTLLTDSDTDDPSSLSDRTFVATILADAILIAGYLLSALRPEHRVWPIGNSSWWSWRRWFNWTALSVVYAGFLLLSYFDRDTFIFTKPRSSIIGGILSALGLGVSIRALLGLGVEESSGKKGELRTGGFYRYTRNPQSVGVVAAIAGGILLADSRRMLVHGLLTIVVYVLFPFAEEPWLREQYGDAYEEYCRSVPRFIGWTTVRRLIHDR